MKLRPGMVLAMEPMVNQGTDEVEVLVEHWTAVTHDSKLSAHFEHTVLVTEGGPEVLTRRRAGQVGRNMREYTGVRRNSVLPREDACHFWTKVVSRRASRVPVVRERVI